MPTPPKVTAVELGAAPPSELVRQGCVGLAPRRMAGPLGLLALGSLLSELVISAQRGDRAHGVDHTKRSDLALHRGLRSSCLVGWVRHGTPKRREGRHHQRHSPGRSSLQWRVGRPRGYQPPIFMAPAAREPAGAPLPSGSLQHWPPCGNDAFLTPLGRSVDGEEK